ncbi:murein transglycosylase A [Arcobacter sp. LA11]|uniref:murein transglycosylase A n=1 Tax=Arcobacter sp. LA11 TaxID=1898176 RepID=UPI000933AB58|nr:murein transglycosylase A [Arcobacter sp. LA11]
MKSLSIITILFIILFTGCSQKEPLKLETLKGISKAKVKKVDIKDIEGFYEDDLSLAFDVFKKDCKRAKRYELFKDICLKAESFLNPSQFFSENFTAYELYNNNGTNNGLITGYYEPLLQGSRIKSEKYKYPVYKVPKDMYPIDLSAAYPELKKYRRLRGKLVNGKIVAYDDRAQLNKRTDLEPIVYVDDEIDLFFLQIQGSGKVALDTGETINVGYANQNGHKYFAIGRALLKEGVLKKTGASLQGIKKYLKQNPHRVEEILNKNKSYIFFIENKKSATGALGTELTAGRNLAVDRRYIPLGMPVFINTKSSVSQEKINRLMVAADVGGAIKGEIRADFFFGNGSDAELQAGGMKEKGKLTILVPNE